MYLLVVDLNMYSWNLIASLSIEIVMLEMPKPLKIQITQALLFLKYSSSFTEMY
jgi:hypothetical protein